jgi:hypothetical protein
MNVLILTPDRVGSTLLQRTLTIYMLRREFGRPVINLHELTNGLIKYFHTDLNQEVLGKPEGNKWGYFQSLPEIVELLKSVPHFKTSRLAHYHIQNRQDSINDQMAFYQYLNENFFIISCRRENLFDHALSWGINAHSKKLNVYSAQEKVASFADLYSSGITIERPAFLNYLEKYKRYIAWTDCYFNVQSYFNYEKAANNLEDYILGLDFMQGYSNNSWKDMFGLEFNDWNSIHKLIPDSYIANDPSHQYQKILPDVDKHTWKQLAGADWPDYKEIYNPEEIQQLPIVVQHELTNNNIIKSLVIPDSVREFVEQHLQNYAVGNSQINQLVRDGYLVSGVPIKLQTLREKQSLIKNFNQCQDWYNEWAVLNNYQTIDDLAPYFLLEKVFDDKIVIEKLLK